VRPTPRERIAAALAAARAEPRAAAIVAGLALAVVGLAAGGYLLGSGRLGADRAKANREEATYRNALQTIREDRTRRPKLDADLKAYVDRTLGSTAEACDAQLRSRLNRLGEEIGLRDFRVVTGTSSARGTPAKSEFGRAGADRALRDEMDFVEVSATVNGDGSLEQAMRLLHRIEIEPWLKRVDSVRFEQLGDGERLKIALKLTTLFLPGRERQADLRVADADLAGFDRYRPLLAAHPFRVPPPVGPVPPSPPPTAIATDEPPTAALVPGFPYDQWQLTGLIDGPAGMEAWLRHRADGSAAVLQPGQSMGGVTFLGFTADLAEFAAGGDRFRVQIGEPLSMRRPPA